MKLTCEYELPESDCDGQIDLDVYYDYDPTDCRVTCAEFVSRSCEHVHDLTPRQMDGLEQRAVEVFLNGTDPDNREPDRDALERRMGR